MTKKSRRITKHKPRTIKRKRDEKSGKFISALHKATQDEPPIFYSGMSFEKIQSAADKIYSQIKVGLVNDKELRQLLILIANLAARLKELQAEQPVCKTCDGTGKTDWLTIKGLGVNVCTRCNGTGIEPDC